MTEPRDEARDVLAEALYQAGVAVPRSRASNEWYATVASDALGLLAARGYRLTPEPAPDVAALRALSDAATPGPYQFNGHPFTLGGADAEFAVAAANYVRAALHPADPSRTYEDRVQAMAYAIHEDCVLEWQGIAAVDPNRQITMHTDRAHYGQAHALVRRIWPDGDPSRREPASEPEGAVSRLLWRARVVAKAWLARHTLVIEFCQDCGRRQPIVWTAPNELWAAVTECRLEPDMGGVLCPECFDRRATTQGRFLRWAPLDESNP